MKYTDAMDIITEADGTKAVKRKVWKSPRQHVRWFSHYTRFTGFRSLCLAAWYPKPEDKLATDWEIV